MYATSQGPATLTPLDEARIEVPTALATLIRELSTLTPAGLVHDRYSLVRIATAALQAWNDFERTIVPSARTFVDGIADDFEASAEWSLDDLQALADPTALDLVETDRR